MISDVANCNLPALASTQNGSPCREHDGNISDLNEEWSTHNRIWKPYLYTLHKQAPQPRKISTEKIVSPQPPYFGDEYHGLLSHQQAIARLVNEGDYLIRRSPSDNASLSFRVNGSVHHYRLFYDGQYYVSEAKKFDSIDQLVADGLLCMYMNLHAGDYIAKMPTSVTIDRAAFNTFRKRMRFTVERSTRRHDFKLSTLKGFNWCDWCGDFIWGLLSQGVQCSACNSVTHQRCSEKYGETECIPSSKRRIFGVDLSTQVEGNTIPFVITMCIKEIEDRGLNVEGLYRMSGYKEEIAALKDAFEKDRENTKLGPAEYENVHVITGVLKQYLRLLPLPLIPYDYHERLFKALEGKRDNDVTESVRCIIKELPAAHFHTLKYLIDHFSRIINYCQITRMTARNLATVVNQTIMPVHLTQYSHIDNAIKIIEILITKNNYIFC